MNSKALTPAAPSAVSNLPVSSPSLLTRVAMRYGVDPDKMMTTLKATAFKGNVSNEQMMALLIVSEQYGLNPWTKEIYAFPDKNNGIVPVVGVDGWIRIINSNPDVESVTFEDGPLDENGVPVWIECAIKLRTRTAPLAVKEYFAECYRDVGPWKSHPRRMLRHKTLIQAGRIALGFVGIYDPDEAERIQNATDVTPRIAGKPRTSAPRARTIQQDPPPAATITVDQATELRDIINAEGIDTTFVLAKLEIGSLEDLPAARYGEARALLDEVSRDVG